MRTSSKPVMLKPRASASASSSRRASGDNRNVIALISRLGAIVRFLFAFYLQYVVQYTTAEMGRHRNITGRTDAMPEPYDDWIADQETCAASTYLLREGNFVLF
jgi:hypothetical protein